MNERIAKWAVAATVLITLLASFVWYMIFGAQYFRLRGIDPATAGMTASQALVLVGRHIVVVLVVAYLVSRLRITSWRRGLWLGVLLWCGFPLVLLAGSVSSDGVPRQLAAIHGGDWLIKLVLAAVILAIWPSRKGQ
jgi:hypothetical protein